MRLCLRYLLRTTIARRRAEILTPHPLSIRSLSFTKYIRTTDWIRIAACRLRRYLVRAKIPRSRVAILVVHTRVTRSNSFAKYIRITDAIFVLLL